MPNVKTFTVPGLQNANSDTPAKFQNADGTNAKVIFTAGSNDSVILSILMNSDDPSARAVQLVLFDGTNDFLLDTIAVPAGYGTTGANPAVDGLTNAGLPLNANGKKFLQVPAGWQLKAKMVAPVTATNTVIVQAKGSDY